MRPNAQYNVVAPPSLVARVTLRMRRTMYAEFLATCGVEPADTILDVGVTEDRSFEHSNYLEAWHPFKDRITATGVDDAAFLETLYPGITFVAASGLDLPFGDGSFDFVHSSAVIEHVGNAGSQVQFLRENWRVARRGIFLTTPNRWFPIEFHTVLPLLHWAPPAAYRRILRLIGRDFFADEANLNLLTVASLKGLAARAGIASARVSTVSLLGWPSNLILAARRS
jgi:hypothetical protein